MDLTVKTGRELLRRVRDISGCNVFLCMQCGVCSSACTGRKFMDLLPRQVMRMVQMGDVAVLDCRSAWVCSTCLICTARCPRGIDIAGVMEALRAINQRCGKEVLVAGDIRRELLAQVPLMAITSGYRKLSY